MTGHPHSGPVQPPRGVGTPRAHDIRPGVEAHPRQAREEGGLVRACQPFAERSRTRWPFEDLSSSAKLERDFTKSLKEL